LGDAGIFKMCQNSLVGLKIIFDQPAQSRPITKPFNLYVQFLKIISSFSQI
jgi:hypothetical protein